VSISCAGCRANPPRYVPPEWLASRWHVLPPATKSFAHAVTSPEHVFENALCIETEFVLGADWFLFCTRTPKREGSAKVDALYRGL